MPYIYIGRKNDFIGKTLWEIVSNLKDFGVGRIVYRNIFHERYPEPSYMKIMKVAALPEEQPYQEKGITYCDNRKVIALVQKTFRGKTFDKLIQIDRVTYKNDFRLVPKDEEAEFCRQVELPKERILPAYAEYPPLFKKLVIRNMKAAGEPVNKDPKLRMFYNKFGYVNYRVAEEGETPTETLSPLGKQKLCPHLYED